MGRRTMSSEEAAAMSQRAQRARDYAGEARMARERDAAAAEHEQFMRDLRGDHDGPASYAWIPESPPDSTPTYIEMLSREA